VRVNWSPLALIILLVIFLAGLYGCSQRTAVQAASEIPNETSISERDFMSVAAEGYMADIEMATVAKTHSKNADVKRFAAGILKERTTNLKDLAELMNRKSVSRPDSLLAETRQDIDRMVALTGPEFDREFVNTMVSHQEKTLEVFRRISQAAHDTDVQDYVDELIPKLDKQLRKAQELQSKLFNDEAPPSRNKTTQPTYAIKFAAPEPE
jgi:putative membrane protein